ncbi:MAG: tetratricopeptide repeat protein, partial [Candidatus Latescibacterota bacterium]
RLYLASAGVSLAVAWCLAHLLRTRRPGIAWGVVGVYTTVLAVVTAERVPVWTDELTLWQDAAPRAPLMLKPQLRLGDALAERGRAEEAEAAYLHAVALRPQHPGVRNNLGLLYARQGRLAPAEEQFRAALGASPRMVPARLNLAGLLLRQGRWQEAEAQCDTALQAEDTQGAAQKQLAQIALRFRGDPTRALAYYDEALQLPLGAGSDAWCGRGVALRALGRAREAEESYRRALALDPRHAESWLNLGNLLRDGAQAEAASQAYGQAVASSSDAELRALALEQLRLLHPQRPQDTAGKPPPSL